MGGGSPTATDTIPASRSYEKYVNQKIPDNLNRTNSGIAPYSGPWTDVQIFHLLRRTTFGVKKRMLICSKQ